MASSTTTCNPNSSAHCPFLTPTLFDAPFTTTLFLNTHHCTICAHTKAHRFFHMSDWCSDNYSRATLPCGHTEDLMRNYLRGIRCWACDTWRRSDLCHRYCRNCRFDLWSGCCVEEWLQYGEKKWEESLSGDGECRAVDMDMLEVEWERIKRRGEEGVVRSCLEVGDNVVVGRRKLITGSKAMETLEAALRVAEDKRKKITEAKIRTCAALLLK